MENSHIVVIGGSTGALEALRRILANLPDGLNAAFCVVLHISPDSPGYVPDILDRAGKLPVSAAREGEKLRAGAMVVAPPDRHLLIARDGTLRLGSGPRENLFRPAVDPLFRSAAAFGARVIGVILSGGLDDGAAGAAYLKANGGRLIVQDPTDASVPSMPRAALRATDVDHRIPAHAIADCLVALLRKPVLTAAEPVMNDRTHDAEIEIAAGAPPDEIDISTMASPSLLTCPHCAGVLLEFKDPPLRFRCHTGHAYTAETLAAMADERAEETLYAALRALHEQAFLLQERLKALESGPDRAVLESQVERVTERATRVRELLHDNGKRGP